MFESVISGDRTTRYTLEQAFRGIQAFVAEQCGPKVILQLDEPLVTYEQAARESHECPLEFLEDLGAYFQIQWSETRWGLWLKLRDRTATSRKQRKAAWERWQQETAPQITVRCLVELIVRKARVPSFEAVTIFGSHCEPAGAFLGLCALPEMKERRVAPSTSLLELKSSQQICVLWKRAEWINGVTLPTLQQPSPWQGRTAADILQGVTYIAAFASAASAAVGVWLAGGVVLSGLAAMAAGVATLCFGNSIVDRLHNPLPPNVERFGDLARLIAEGRRTELARVPA